MAEPVPVPLGLTSSDGRTPAEGGARLINCYASRVGDQAKQPYPIYAADGFDLFATIEDEDEDVGPIRGGIPLEEMLYVVSGERVARVGGDASVLVLDGTVAPTGLVSMARNRKLPDAQIALCITGSLYTIEADVLTAVDLEELGSQGTPVAVATVDGYFLILFSNGEFFISGIDTAAIDPLDFAKAEANPDGGVFIVVLGNDVIIFGPQSTEFWQNTAATDFPFERTLTRSYGCYAGGSVQKLVQTQGGEGGGVADTLVFAATDSKGAYLGVCLMQGTSPVKISSPDLDRKIRAEADPDSITSQTWSNGERSFYVISGSGFSFGYDFSTGYWHERQSSSLDFWRIREVFTFGSKTIAGDYELAQLYWMRDGLYNDEDPSVLTLKHSNDGGQTWVTRDPREIGTTNQKQRARFNRIGRGKSLGKVFELSISEAVMENGIGLPMTIKTPMVHAWPQAVKVAAAHVDIVPAVSESSRNKGILGFALQAEPVTEQAH